MKNITVSAKDQGIVPGEKVDCRKTETGQKSPSGKEDIEATENKYKVLKSQLKSTSESEISEELKRNWQVLGKQRMKGAK